MSVSLNLEHRINKLYYLGEISAIGDSVILADKTKKIIKIVGECIRGTIANEQNQNEVLIAISKVIHAGKYCLSSNSDIKKLSEFTKCNTDEIESTIKLVKHIENRINKQL